MNFEPNDVNISLNEGVTLFKHRKKNNLEPSAPPDCSNFQQFKGLKTNSLCGKTSCE